MAGFFKRAAAALGLAAAAKTDRAQAAAPDQPPPSPPAPPADRRPESPDADIDALWTEAELELAVTGVPRSEVARAEREVVKPKPVKVRAATARDDRPARAAAKKPPPPSKFTVWVKCDGAEIVIKCPYFPPARDAFKAVKASFIVKADAPTHRCWRMQVAHAGRLVRLIKGLSGTDAWTFADGHEELAAAVDEAIANPDPMLLADDIQVTLYAAHAANEDPDDDPSRPSAENAAADFLVVMAPYHAGVNRVIAGMGGKFSPANKAWIIPSASPAVFRNQVLDQFPVPADRIHTMDGVYYMHGSLPGSSGAAQGLRLSKSASSPVKKSTAGETLDVGHMLADIPPRMRSNTSRDRIDEMIGRYECDDYQVVGVRHLLEFNSSLLADDMGLGKTRQGIIAADISRQGGQVLVVAPASLLLNWRKEIEMVAPAGATFSVGALSDQRVDWTIISYHQLESAEKRAGQFSVLLLDEAHKLKNPRTMMTRLAFSVAQKIRTRMVLTGTPLLNNEQEIHTLLRLSGHPLGMLDMAEFKENFAGGGEQRLALNRELSNWMLRRDKATVLTLKGKRRDKAVISLSSDEMAEYDQIAGSEQLLPFQKITKLRQLLEASKIDYILDRIESRAPMDKFIVFCAYKESVNTLSAALKAQGIGVVTLTGDDSKKKRQAAVDKFQEDPQCLVFMGTNEAAGVGITLTAANRVIFAGMPWTMALLEQAEDRANRRGQTRVVRSEIVLADETIDTQIMDLLEHKGDITQEVVVGMLSRRSIAARNAREAEMQGEHRAA